MSKSNSGKSTRRKKYGRFAVQPFRNPSGEKVYRVSGSINGRRIRRNFETRNEAIIMKQDLELQRLAEENHEKVVVTSLTRSQCEEAKIAFKLLEGRRKPLSFYVQYALERYREAEFELSLETAMGHYLDHKETECERNLITAVQVRTMKTQLNSFTKEYSERPIGEIDSDLVLDWLDRQRVGKSGNPVSPKTYNNKRGYLNTFFKFCVTKDWLSVNPVDRVPQFTIKARRGSAETITAKKAAQLMAYLEECDAPGHSKGFLVPYFALCLFAGLRPDIRTGEIGRLAPSDVRLDTGVIMIEPEVSKVDEKRSIKIQPNLGLWLERYPLGEYAIVPSRLEWHRRKIRGKFSLVHNVLRHTFISMTVGAFKSVGDAALQAGNSESVIRKHYLDLKTETEADDFWRIVPGGHKLPLNLVKKDGRFVED